jgi:hypothetical protein
VGECGAQELRLAELVADGLLTFFQDLGFKAAGNFLLHKTFHKQSAALQSDVTMPREVCQPVA